MICAEWIDYMDAYRIYDPKCPAATWAYADSLKEAECIAETCGEKLEVKP